MSEADAAEMDILRRKLASQEKMLKVLMNRAEKQTTAGIGAFSAQALSPMAV